MIHLIRKDYWYKDEYILDKTLGWLHSSVAVILEDRYNQNLQLSWLVQLHIWQIFSSEKINIPEWNELWKKEEIEDTELSDWGLWIW